MQGQVSKVLLLALSSTACDHQGKREITWQCQLGRQGMDGQWEDWRSKEKRLHLP